MKKVIAFVCTHNSCRSQMAEGWAKHLASDIFEVYSAGTEKYPAPKELALEVMEDIGISMKGHYSKLLNEIPTTLDILITMGCGVECPFVPTKFRKDWELDDPSGGVKEDFEITRDLIKKRVVNLVKMVKNGEI